MVMYKIKIEGGCGIELATIKSLKWVKISSLNMRLKLKGI
jgi:hypothetical protein